YINNIIVFSNTLDKHLKYLETVRKILQDNRIHTTAEGIAKTNNCIKAFQKIKMPETLSDLETYLGM
ncbi:hypothetical protein QBC33DRAFT_434329, partial [Phialemonium atrogriseum]